MFISEAGDLLHLVSRLHTAPEDYGSVSQILTFKPGSTERQCVTVRLHRDDVDERDEKFLVKVTGEKQVGDYVNYRAIVTVTISGRGSILLCKIRLIDECKMC